MAEYRGLRAIAARLGYKQPITARKLIYERGLLAYKRQLRGYSRECWCTTDELILLWQVSKGRVDVAKARARRDALRVARAARTRQSPGPVSNDGCVTGQSQELVSPHEH